jgi:hypothetical protein
VCGAVSRDITIYRDTCAVKPAARLPRPAGTAIVTWLLNHLPDHDGNRGCRRGDDELAALTLDDAGRLPLRDVCVVSGTMRELVLGSGFGFDDRGSHVLDGVPGEWRIYAARIRARRVAQNSLVGRTPWLIAR